MSSCPQTRPLLFVEGSGGRGRLPLTHPAVSQSHLLHWTGKSCHPRHCHWFAMWFGATCLAAWYLGNPVGLLGELNKLIISEENGTWHVLAFAMQPRFQLCVAWAWLAELQTRNRKKESVRTHYFLSQKLGNYSWDSNFEGARPQGS